MPWQPDHKSTTRQRISNSAAELFTHQGFEAVSIDAVMKHAGLTRGAFYAHFKNKAELYQEAVIAGAIQAKKLLDSTATHDAKSFAEHYLQLGDATNPRGYCPLAFFVTDIAQQDDTVKDTYTKALGGYLEILKSFNLDEDDAHQAAILLIGGLAISRAITDDDLKQSIHAAAIKGVMVLAKQSSAIAATEG